LQPDVRRPDEIHAFADDVLHLVDFPGHHVHGGKEFLVLRKVGLENGAVHPDAGDRVPDLMRQSRRHLAEQKKALLQVFALLRHLHLGEILEKGTDADFEIALLEFGEGESDELPVSVFSRKFHFQTRGQVVHREGFAQDPEEEVLSRPEMDILSFRQGASLQDLRADRVDVRHRPVEFQRRYAGTKTG
jgi:hypothetical protein